MAAVGQSGVFVLLDEFVHVQVVFAKLSQQCAAEVCRVRDVGDLV